MGITITMLSIGMIASDSAADAPQEEEKAQRPQAGDTSKAAEERKFKLKEVTVTGGPDHRAVPDKASTATKTDTPIKDIPASVFVIPKERLYDQGAYSISGILRNVPGVTQAGTSNYGFFNNFLSRGLETQFLRDGIPDGASVNGYARTLTDVERVEFLKGPATALYGRGEPGGSVNLISKPALARPLFFVYGRAGSFDTRSIAIDTGGPLGSETLRSRFNFSHYYSGGFRDLRNETTEVLPTLTWKPNDRHTVTLDFDYRKIKAVADNEGIPFLKGSILAVPLETKYYTPFGDTNQDVFRGAVHHQYQLTNDLVIQNNFVLLRRNLFLARNEGGTLNPTTFTISGRRFREQRIDETDIIYQLQPIWKVKTYGIGHTILGGFEYQHQTMDTFRQRASLPNIVNAFNPVIPETSRDALTFAPVFDRDAKINRFAVYGQDQVTFNEQWKARGGIRWERYDSFDIEQVKKTNQSRSDDRVSGNAGVVYEPIPWTSFYASFSRGHFVSFSSEGAARRPERSTQYEVGNKSTFLDGRISATLSLFDVARENFLISVAGDTIPIGEQRTRGVEFNLASEPIPGWLLSANYAFLDAELTKLAPGDPNVGNRPLGVPRHSAALWTTYELQDGPLAGLGFGGGPVFKGRNFADNGNTNPLPSFTILDLVLFYRRGSTDIQMNFNNVTNADYFSNPQGTRSAAPGQPFNVLATVSWAYDGLLESIPYGRQKRQ